MQLTLVEGVGACLTASRMGELTVIVQVQIKPEAVEEFEKVMAIDVAGSRAEEGCLRFDLLTDQADANTFYFYDVPSHSA